MKTSILYAIYEYDTPLFVSAFCENKDKPQLHCNGKCVLARMQKEQRDQSNQQLLKQLQMEVTVCPIPNCIEFQQSDMTDLHNRTYAVFSHPIYTYLFSDPRKKPPQA